MLEVGDQAPEFTLYTLDDEPYTLSDLTVPVHLVFLRHLGCLPEFDYVETLNAHQPEFLALGLPVWIITFVEPEIVHTWKQETRVPFPVLLDTNRAVYNAYKLKRSLWKSWHPVTLWYYARQLAQGAKLKPGRGDPNQLGGDFTVGRNGKLTFVHYIDNPTDRPPIDQLLRNPYD